MQYIKHILILFFLLAGALSCQEWEDHYAVPGGLLEKSVWESISAQPEFSLFSELVEEYSLDTIFESSVSYTIFVPDNQGMDSIDFNETDPLTFIKSHIANTVFLTRNISGSKKLKTLSGKYAFLEEDTLGYLFNNARISRQSEMHRNGLYYALEGASRPFDNLFQYVERVSPSIAGYIRSQDSSYLDLALSRPVDINDDGEIIYDSVMISINLFEMLYFPLSEEFRNNKATVVFPTEQQYQGGLDAIKQALGLPIDFEIPRAWQYDVLMPFIMNHGLFEDEVEAEVFANEKMKNILGDSVVIDYMPVEPYRCSNGLAYQYDVFSVPDSLYLSGYRREGEQLAASRGLGIYAWKDQSVVRVTGASSFEPEIQKVSGIASNDSILFVNFGKNFTGEYAVEFKIENVFPGQYQCIWRSNPRFGGVYSVYVNDELQTLPFNLTEFDLDYLNGAVISVTGDQYFYPDEGYNKLDCLTTVEEFGDVWIRLEYKGPGDNQDNGLIIDYIELVPYN